MKFRRVRDGNEPFVVNTDNVVAIEAIEGGRACMLIMSHGGTLRLSATIDAVLERLEPKSTEEWLKGDR